jgi:hypothetical protein
MLHIISLNTIIALLAGAGFECKAKKYGAFVLFLVLAILSMSFYIFLVVCSWRRFLQAKKSQGQSVVIIGFNVLSAPVVENTTGSAYV